MESSQNQTKPALIAAALYIFIQLLLFNTSNFNILFSGVYLGINKNVGKKTIKTFFFIVMVFHILDDIFLKNALNDPQRPAIVALYGVFIGSAIGAFLPIAVMWITRKIRKKALKK